MSQENEWHLDKRVPLALILALLLQTGGIVWWAASLTGDVIKNEDRILRLEGNASATQKLTERVIRLEVILNRLDQTLTRLDRKMDQEQQRRYNNQDP